MILLLLVRDQRVRLWPVAYQKIQTGEFYCSKPVAIRQWNRR